MRLSLLPLLPLIVASSAVGAQSAPDSISGDARFRSVNYEAGGIFQLPTSPDTVQTILLGQGEVIRSVILSNPAAYMVIVSGKGDSLSLRPNGPSTIAMMSIRTDARSYELELTAGSQSDAPAVVRFIYGALPKPAPQAADPSVQVDRARYRLSGSQALRPVSITDDGLKTYIAWKADQPMPAVFAVSDTGKEEMVDGYVRGGVFTLDRVLKTLVFRIDRERAAARRLIERE